MDQGIDMIWRYDTSDLRICHDVSFLKQFIVFLQSCLSQRHGGKAIRPGYVPGSVRVLREIRAEIPGRNNFVSPGVYDCEHNQWGAISVVSSDGTMLGVRPDECVVRGMVLNGHLL